MKILMTSDTFLPLIGGAEIHVQNLIEELEKNGYEVVLVTNEITGSDFDKKHPVIRTPWSRKGIFSLFKLLWRESEEVDVIHCHYSYRLAMVAGIIGRLRNIPVVVVLHGLGTLNIPNAEFVYRTIHSIYRYASLALSTHIISTSDDLAQVARKYVSTKKISIILNGYDAQKFNTKVEIPDSLKRQYENSRVVLTVRRLVPKNGIHFLVEAIPFIVKKVPNLKYIMIGDGRMREYIEERINKLGVQKYIDVLGLVENDQIPAYLKLADVVVFPSTAESSSIACAEAMGMGKNIVSSRVGGLPELLGKNEERGKLITLVSWEGSNYDAPLTLDEERYKDLANMISESILFPDIMRADAAMRYAEQELSWWAIGKKTMMVYDKLIKKC
ncbi:MAG: glycosyltransferase family 4 protein [Minisyncoccia bacterium]